MNYAPVAQLEEHLSSLNRSPVPPIDTGAHRPFFSDLFLFRLCREKILRHCKRMSTVRIRPGALRNMNECRVVKNRVTSSEIFGHSVRFSPCSLYCPRGVVVKHDIDHVRRISYQVVYNMVTSFALKAIDPGSNPGGDVRTV